MKCLTPIWIRETSDNAGVEVPCGRCPNCVQTKRSVWTFRLMNELKASVSAFFITLTYAPENIPLIKQYGAYVSTLKKNISRISIRDYVREYRRIILRMKDGPGGDPPGESTRPDVRYGILIGIHGTDIMQ